MLSDISRALLCALLAVTPCVLALQLQPAAAQVPAPGKGCGDVSEPGGRTISAQDSTPCARYYVPYAILAAGAYHPVKDFNDTRDKTKRLPPGTDVNIALREAGLDGTAAAGETPDLPGKFLDHARKLMSAWRYQFGSQGYIGCLHDTDKSYPADANCERARPSWFRPTFAFGGGPAFNVWTRRNGRNPCTEASIVFRGTMETRDIIPDLHNYTFGIPDDAYRQLERNIDAIVGRIAGLKCYRKKATQIVSVGHSLGAGLAQLAALAQRRGPRIAKVFAFDPSPVTGSGLVADATLDRNVRGKRPGRALEIDRVYQVGELLETARTDTKEDFPSSFQQCNPLVRNVRFDVTGGQRDPLGEHAIRGTDGLARGLVKKSYNSGQPFSPPAAISDCPTRYRPPTTDDWGTPVASAAPGQPVYPRAGSVATIAGANRHSSKGAAARVASANVH